MNEMILVQNLDVKQVIISSEVGIIIEMEVVHTLRIIIDLTIEKIKEERKHLVLFSVPVINVNDVNNFVVN